MSHPSPPTEPFQRKQRLIPGKSNPSRREEWDFEELCVVVLTEPVPWADTDCIPARLPSTKVKVGLSYPIQGPWGSQVKRQLGMKKWHS